MTKIFKGIIFISLMCVFLTACQNTSEAVEETMSYEEVYNLINNNEFYQSFIENPLDEDMKSKMEEVTEIKQEKFEEVSYMGNLFPERLVYSVQEALYNAYISNTIGQDDEKFFFDLLKELDDSYEKHEIAEWEVISELYYGPEFQFDLGDKKAYLRGWDAGGTSGLYIVDIYTYIDGMYTEIASFDTQGEGCGRVIQYEGNFYYIFLQANYNLKFYDGIRIYKLGENAETENILIRIIPEKYVWKNFYNDDTAPNGLEEYIDTIKDEVTSEEYIERGGGEPYPFYGDITEDKNFPGEKYEEYIYNPDFYKADFTNLNCPIDFHLGMHIPSNGTKMQLRASFYIYDSENEKAWSLDALNIDTLFSPDKNRLIQMWFKELDGKVYTFQIYHLENYEYMLNVILIEGNQITQLRKDLLLPQYKIAMTEEEKFCDLW